MGSEITITTVDDFTLQVMPSDVGLIAEVADQLTSFHFRHTLKGRRVWLCCISFVQAKRLLQEIRISQSENGELIDLYTNKTARQYVNAGNQAISVSH